MARTRRTRMPIAAKLAPAVVVAGVVLGWLLGSAANPVMKQQAGSAASAMPQLESAAVGPDERWPNLDVVPETFDMAGGRPDLDYDAVVGSEWALPDGPANAGLAPPSPLDDALDAAGRAEQAVEEAQEAAIPSPAPDRPETPIGSRKSDLAQSGLY